MKEKHFNNWQKVREKGKSNFIYTHGLLYWALPMFVVMTFIVFKPPTGDMKFLNIAIKALVWGLSGLGVGHLNWTISERSYQKELEKRKNG